MKVSHEVPLCLLEESLQFNDYDYCLPHLLDQHEEYKNLDIINIKKRFKSKNNLLVDIKSIYNKNNCLKNQIDIYQI